MADLAERGLTATEPLIYRTYVWILGILILSILCIAGEEMFSPAFLLGIAVCCSLTIKPLVKYEQYRR